MIEISGYCVSLGETQVQIAKIEERKGLKRKIAPLAKVIFFAVFRIIELVEVLTTNSKDFLKGRGYE